MDVDLAGRTARLAGRSGPVLDAIGAALLRSGAIVAAQRHPDPPDLLVVAHDLFPGVDAEAAAALDDLAAGEGERMKERVGEAGGARIVWLLPALAVLPMRRHPLASAIAASSLARMRALAMALAPRVLANAVAVGPVAARDGLIGGDPAMLTHAVLGRPGTIDDVVAAVLFLCDPENSYTTGQVLPVDGGWTAGYARDF